MTNQRISVTITPELSAWLDTWRGTLSRSAAARILIEQGMALHRDHRLADNSRGYCATAVAEAHTLRYDGMAALLP